MEENLLVISQNCKILEGEVNIIDRAVSEQFHSETIGKNAMSELRKSITSGNFHLIALPARFGPSVLLLLKNERIHSELGAAVLNVRHEGFLELLNEGKLPCERNESGVFVISDDFVEFKEIWDRERKEALERLFQIDSEEDYI